MSNVKQRISRLERDMKIGERLFIIEADYDRIKAGLVDTKALVREKYGAEPTDRDMIVTVLRFADAGQRGWRPPARTADQSLSDEAA